MALFLTFAIFTIRISPLMAEDTWPKLPNPAQGEQIGKAVDIITEYEKQGAKKKNVGKKLLERIKAKSILIQKLAKKLDKKTNGQTRWFGPKVIIDEAKFTKKKKATGEGGYIGDPAFAHLLVTLLHEGKHCTQAPIMATTPILTKMDTIEAEIPAYEQGLKFKASLLKNLKKIMDNKNAGKPATKGVDKCFQIFKDQTTTELWRIILSFMNEFDWQANVVVFLRSVKNEDEYDMDGDGDLDDDDAKILDNYENKSVVYGAFMHTWREDPTVIISTDSEGCYQYFPETNERIHFNSGLDKPLDGQSFLAEDTGTMCVIIVGMRDYTAGEGAIASLADVDGDGILDMHSLQYIETPGIQLENPTCIVEDYDGKLFVFDAGTGSLYPFEDTDGNLVPDALSPSIFSTNPVFQEQVREFSFLAWEGDNLVARHSVILKRHNQLVVGNITDSDMDGIYDSIRVGRYHEVFHSGLSPAFMGLIYKGSNHVWIGGTEGHRVVLYSKAQNGQEKIEGEVSVGSIPVVPIITQEGLNRNMEYYLLDTITGEKSVLLRPEPKREVNIAWYSRYWISHEDTTEVTVYGNNLDQVKRVSFGGEYFEEDQIEIVEQSRTQMRLIIPPSIGNKEGYANVRFFTKYKEGGIEYKNIEWVRGFCLMFTRHWDAIPEMSQE
jgi:hypothetical protein